MRSRLDPDIPPARRDAAFEDELAAVAAIPPDVLCAHLVETTGGPLPASLEHGDVAQEAAAVLEWIWTRTLATDWPRREQPLRADIVTRTGQPARGNRRQSGQGSTVKHAPRPSTGHRGTT